MSKKFQSMTYADRMQNPCHKCKPNVPHYDTYVLEEKRELNNKLGRVLPKSTFKKIEKNPLAHLKVNDFSLENLQAIGAPLNVCTMRHDNNTATAIMENNIAMFNQSQKPE